MKKQVYLKDVCEKGSSNIAQKDLESNQGAYPIYGASGLIKHVDFFKQDKPYIAIVKDGAGVGRTMLLPAYSSVIGTMQYIFPKDNIHIRYLYHALSWMNLGKYYTGATIPHIYFKDYQDEPLMLPSMEEQEEIVSVLDKLDQLVEQRKQQLSKLDELVKSRFIEMFGDPIANEKGWSMYPLERVCKTIVDCPHSTPNYTTEDTGYMCIRTSIVKKNRILWDEIEYISQEEYNQRIQRKRPEKGDVVYTREGAILGIAAMIDRDCNVALGQRSMLLSPNTDQCLPQFLSVAMNFESFLMKALGGISGSASPHINVGDIKSFTIILPPIELQKRFAAFNEQVDKSKFEIQKSLEKLETLKKALMQKYFG